MSGELDDLVRKLLMMQSDTPESMPIKAMFAAPGETADPLHSSARRNDPDALRRLWLEDRCYSSSGTLNPMGFDEAMRQEQVRDGDCIQMIGSDERDRWNDVNKEVALKGMHFGKGDPQ